VGVMALLAEHVLRPALGCEVGAHVSECWDYARRVIMTGPAPIVVIGSGQTDIIAKDTGDMGRIGNVTGITGQSTGEGRLGVTLGGAQGPIGGGDALDLGAGGTDMAAFTAYSTTLPDGNSLGANVAGIAGDQ
jgi:hypothetical protein